MYSPTALPHGFELDFKEIRVLKTKTLQLEIFRVPVTDFDSAWPILDFSLGWEEQENLYLLLPARQWTP